MKFVIYNDRTIALSKKARMYLVGLTTLYRTPQWHLDATKAMEFDSAHAAHEFIYTNNLQDCQVGKVTLF